MHSFVLTVPIDGIATTIQVVYPTHQLEDGHLTAGIDMVVENYNRRLIPSRLLFICPNPMVSRIKECFEQRKERYEGRLRSITHITVATFDRGGVFAPQDVVHLCPPATAWRITDQFLLMLARRGIAALFEETETILHAPHGYSFRKPSGREEDIFVRAGNMLRQPHALALFNHLLLRHLPSDCATLYIDSFTILSFAMGLQSVSAYFGLRTPAIESIHSYDIPHDVWIPHDRSYLFLISASTSGGLAQKLVHEHHAEPSRIVHLLGVGPTNAPFAASCIYFHAREIKANTPASPGQANATIEIRTEEFLVSQGAPRPVRITEAHIDKHAAGELHQPFYRRALQFGRSPLKRRYSPFSIANDIKDSHDSPLRAWATQRLVHDLPASVRMLLHMDDSMAERIARWLADALGFHVVVKRLEQFDPGSEDNSPTNTIAVIAHHDPDLEDLARASIALRRLPDIHRHYVVGYGFPSSQVEHKRRQVDLRMASNRRRYGWSQFLVLPVGAAMLHDSFVEHRGHLSPHTLQQHTPVLGNRLYESLLRHVESSTICAESFFLPRTDGAPLALRPGSVFLPQSCSDVSQIAVYAMVASAVQSAREPKATGVQDTARFDDNPFVRAVLDPSMFARYSDGILQASLLRSAQRSELDYSGSDDLSRQFASTCSSVLENHAHPVGDAAPEFLYALATDKVLLREADRARIVTTIASVPILNTIFRLFRSADPISEHLGG